MLWTHELRRRMHLFFLAGYWRQSVLCNVGDSKLPAGLPAAAVQEGASVELALKGNLGVVLASFLSAVACGATFLFALYRQFALVEVAASIATAIEVYLLSSAIGEMLEDRQEPNRLKMIAAIGLAAGIVGYFLISRYLHG